ncbi:MAG: alanine racemase [Candidatus Nanopelagicales bacterium]
MTDAPIDAGPGSFEGQPPAGDSASEYGRAWAEIDLNAIANNVSVLKDTASTAEVMAVVKADAYGHGLIPSARAAQRGGASYLGVALLSEAIALREGGVEGPIFAWLPTPGDEFEKCIALDIELNVGASWMLTEIEQAARKLNTRARIHLKADTGLGRGGTFLNSANSDSWERLVAEVAQSQSEGLVEVVGIWTHLAWADSPFHGTIGNQHDNFVRAIEFAKAAGINPILRHAANSAATFALPNMHFDLVRPGISVFGVSPGPEVGTSESLGIKPAMTLAARLVQVKDLPAGSGVSYGHEYVTSRDTNVGLVPLGYADGIQRAASSAGPVLAAGKVRTIAGRVCMDQFVIELEGDLAQAGDTVTLFGPGLRGEPTATDWADAIGTIPYEIVTCVGPRVPRVFVGGA